MDSVAVLEAEEREALFRETAARMGVASAVIPEKDFWICWTLKRLFSLEGLPSLLFKGGMSLSKAFGLIERFSEDIDLSLNRAELGFVGENDPLRIERQNARRRKIDELSEVCRQTVSERLHPALEAAIRSELGGEGWTLDLVVRDDGELDLQLHYPTALRAGDYGDFGYVRPMVRLEIGARSDHEPSSRVAIRCYAAERVPEFFQDSETEVVALAPERTFWEKATIFHHENHRPLRGSTRPRAWNQLSRHCYDLIMMAQRGVAERALARRDLLAAVVRHNKAFFYAGWSRYDDAESGSFRLVPTDAFRDAIRQDYSRMAPMFFGEPPDFDEIEAALRSLERRINETG